MTWLEGNRPYNVVVQTMLNGTGSALSLDTGTETSEPQVQR
jgi:hypothetical protein